MFIPYCDYHDRIINIVYDAIKDIDILNPENTPEKISSLVRTALMKWEQSVHSPLYILLKNKLVSDIENGYYIENESFWDFYKSLFNEPTGVLQ